MMLRFWPFGGDDTSTASFEKTLSTLSDKIGKTETQLGSLRQSSRRYKALWTLYTSLVYVVYSAIVSLVVKFSDWGVKEILIIIAGPLLIFCGRYLLTAYYNFRTNSVQSRLEVLQKERESTIEKLKAATKYNSTQQLLEKYGGSPPHSAGSTPKQGRKLTTSPKANTPKKDNVVVSRTGLAPPPTANIQSARPVTPTASGERGAPPDLRSSTTQSKDALIEPDSPEFSSNAFESHSAPRSVSYQPEPQWYDRFLDLLMGEDETLAKNRLAMICKHCRLVNGQAPPGIRSPEELGRWRCGGCGKWNGEENNAKRLVAIAKADDKYQGDDAKIEVDSTSSGDIKTSDKEPEDSEVTSANDGSGSGDDKIRSTRRLPARKARSRT